MRFVKEKKIINEDVKIDKFTSFVATGGYIGYIPKASGTFASAAALILYALIPYLHNNFVLLLLIAVSTLLGIITSGKMTDKYGEDASVIVIDEYAGMWLTLFFVNIHLSLLNFTEYTIALLLAFLMFRFFDIVKIQPARWLEKKLKGAWGVMLDDLVAGIYAGCATYIILDYYIFYIK